MPSWEMKLIAQILEKKNPEAVIKRGIIPEMLNSNLLAREIFKYVIQYRLKHGSCPSIDLVRLKFGEYDHFTPEEPVDVLCDILLEERMSKELMNGINDVIADIEANPRGSTDKLHHLVYRISKIGSHSNDIMMSEYSKNFRETYEIIKNRRGLVGLPYPWDALNFSSGGLEPESLTVLYGSSKSCKSWLLLHICSNLYINFGKKVLLITKEMSTDGLARRCIAVMGKLPYSDYKNGLDTVREDKLYELLDSLSSPGELILSTARSETGDVSVPTVMNKIETVAPDIVAIDAAYLMSDYRSAGRGKDSEKVTNLTRDIKDMAQRTRLPIIITTQANRYGDRKSKDSAIGFSISVLQDADTVLDILRDATKSEIAIKMSASREGEEMGFTISAKVAHDFTQKSTTIEDIDRFIREDKKGITSKYEKEYSGTLPGPTLVTDDDEEDE